MDIRGFGANITSLSIVFIEKYMPRSVKTKVFNPNGFSSKFMMKTSFKSKIGMYPSYLTFYKIYRGFSGYNIL
jgi:hypothetical protein